MNGLVRWGVCLVTLLCLWYITAGSAQAHGTDIAYTVGTQVQLQANFDSGEPMANAQVTVYAPDDPATPWLMGEADAEGRFAFAPDTTIPGRWDVFVRTAGHGDSLYFDIDENTAITGVASTGGGLTLPQIILMSASVIWGMVGTALYFARGRTKDAVHQGAVEQGAAHNEQQKSGDDFVPGEMTT